MTNRNEPIQQEKIKCDFPEKLVVAQEAKRESKTMKLAELPSVPPKPNSAERESTYTSMYSKKEVPQTLGEWNKLKTGCAMMLSSGTKGTSKVITYWYTPLVLYDLLPFYTQAIIYIYLCRRIYSQQRRTWQP